LSEGANSGILPRVNASVSLISGVELLGEGGGKNSLLLSFHVKISNESTDVLFPFELNIEEPPLLLNMEVVDGLNILDDGFWLKIFEFDFKFWLNILVLVLAVEVGFWEKINFELFVGV